MKMDQKTMRAMQGEKKGKKGMKAGGPTTMDRKKFGHNMANAKNQRGS